jgi:hypothetical protein
MSRASQPDKQNGTLSVHTIKASGRKHRSNRPNTRLHPTTAPKHQINPCNVGAIHTRHWVSVVRDRPFVVVTDGAKGRKVVPFTVVDGGKR